ncbi:MAG: CPBP family intramembrane metalloprotease [Saprospiraceae bacterium]|nr:CPBP family intramembrane metalloprotease [Saprospiraceae bacterium]
MDNKNLALGSILTIMGLIGIASLLTIDVPFPPDIKAVLDARFTERQLKLLVLVNPTLLLLIAVVVGTVLYQKAKLRVPIIEKIVGIKNDGISISRILKYGILGGVLSGILLITIGLLFQPILTEELKVLGDQVKPSVAARFLYGALTEEILMRYGFMTFVVWLCSKIFRGTTQIVYWIGIITATLIFAVGHFPVVYNAVEQPTASLLTYILIGNSVGGVIFGWLYWKTGLESAIIAHLFSHVMILLINQFLVIY